MPRRASGTTAASNITPYTPARQLHARVGRAAEDPVAMTSDAMLTRYGIEIAEVLKLNPGLTPKQAANAGRLRLKDKMTQLAAKSVEARRQRAELDATGLEDSGEQ